jgi:hypothetical protein
MLSAFISYAHADEKLKDRFLVHLTALKRERLINVWHDRMLRPGEHLDRAIETELAAADLVILLVSPDFINSDYCTEREMQRAFARAKNGECKVVPVILKDCRWRDIPINEQGGRLGDFVALPRDGKPVARSRNRDSALDSVVAGIRGFIKDESASDTVGRPRKKDGGSPQVGTAKETFERDVWLADAIWRAFLGTWDLPPHGERAAEGTSENQRFYDLVTKDFRQAAFDGYLPIWAKRGNSDLWEELPKEFWKDHQISYLTVIREDPTKLSVENALSPTQWRVVGRSATRREFMTSKRAVDARWPPTHRPSRDGRPASQCVARLQSTETSLAPSADEVTCPICKARAKPLDKIGDADGFECPNNGRFRVSGSVLEDSALREASRQRWEDALRRARARQPGEWAPTIMTYDFD